MDDNPTAGSTKPSTTAQDDRGFTKSEMSVMDPRRANFQEQVNLVERDPCPQGFPLVDPDKSGKKNQFDLVELAAHIQQADQFTRATAGSKLAIIAEQARFLQEQAQPHMPKADKEKAPEMDEDQFAIVKLPSSFENAENDGSKLAMLTEQAQFLQEQTHRVLEEANINAELHHIACNFKKIPGKIYYVYKKPAEEDGKPGKKYLSMISPQEWGSKCPEFVAAYKLELDMTWTPYEKIAQRESEIAMIERILRAGTQLKITF